MTAVVQTVAAPSLSQPRKFWPVLHVLTTLEQEAKDGCRLTTAARLLGLVLAAKSRQTVSGAWVSWYGRKKLVDFTGMNPRTIATARAMLEDAAIFVFHQAKRDEVVTTMNGDVYSVKEGLQIAEVVMVPAAVRHQRAQAGRAAPSVERQARASAIKAKARQQDASAIHTAKLELGQRHLRGELTRDEYEQAKANLERAARDARRAGWSHAIQSRDSGKAM